MDRLQLKIIFSRVTEEFLYPLLESEGYRPRGRYGFYCKTDGDNEFRVGVSLYNRPLQGMSMGAGVGFRKVWDFIRQFDYFDQTELISAAGCGGSVENILPRGTHRSWSWIDETSDSELIGQEIVDQFRQYVFPYLDEFRNLENAIKLWQGRRSFEGLARVAAILLLGNRDGAFSELDELIKSAEQEYEERQAGGYKIASAARELDAYRRFRAFLESADISEFRY